MPVFAIAAAVCYVLAVLFAWPVWVNQSLGKAVAFAALGLLFALVAAIGPRVPITRAPPPQG